MSDTSCHICGSLRFKIVDRCDNWIYLKCANCLARKTISRWTTVTANTEER